MRKKRSQEAKLELNLAPIMNLVMILIPLLLLSVVFEQMGVINVSSSNSLVSSELPEPKDPAEKLSLTIGVSPNGFTIAAKDKVLPPLEGCAKKGPTVCVKGDVGGALAESGALRAEYDKNPSAVRRELIKNIIGC